MTQKPWGFVQDLIEKPFLALRACFVFHDGYSSLHYHETKRNTFLVNDGMLAVVSFTPSGVNRVILTRGQNHSVDRFIPHYFHAMTPCQFIEISTGEISQDDIIRIADGGVNDELTVDMLIETMQERYEEFRKEIVRS
jgi:hypothetical protein